MPQRILASLKSLVNERKYLIELQFSLHKCPKPSWQGFRPPQNQANAHLILANSSLKKCPKPTGQGSRPPPPPPYGQCPNACGMNLRMASLSWISGSLTRRVAEIQLNWCCWFEEICVIPCQFSQIFQSQHGCHINHFSWGTKKKSDSEQSLCEAEVESCLGGGTREGFGGSKNSAPRAHQLAVYLFMGLNACAKSHHTAHFTPYSGDLMRTPLLPCALLAPLAVLLE